MTKYEGMVRYKHVQFIPNSHPGDPIKLLALSDAGVNTTTSFWREMMITE